MADVSAMFVIVWSYAVTLGPGAGGGAMALAKLRVDENVERLLFNTGDAAPTE